MGDQTDDVAGFNILRNNGRYCDLTKESLVSQGYQHLTEEQFLNLFNRYHLRYSLTPQCNIWCIFCSNEGSAYSEKLQNNMVNIQDVIALSDILINNTDIQSIDFSGGEPIVHPDFVSGRYELIKWTKKHPQIRFSIHSNGIALNPNIIDQIEDSFFKIGISIHSPKFETWNRMTNLNRYYGEAEQKQKFRMLMRNVDYISKRNIGSKVFVKSVVVRGINDSLEELRAFLKFCAERGFHPKFFEFEPQYREQEQYVVGRAELFDKLEQLGCNFASDTPRHNDINSYIPSINFEYKHHINTPIGVHTLFHCGNPGACRSCYMNLPIFVKPQKGGKGLFIKPCSTIDTRFDLTWALKKGDSKHVLDIIKMSREYLMLLPGLGVSEWNKEEAYRNGLR